MIIQWFPGHMTKAIRMMEDNLKLVDALIYVVDARAVASCNNPLFDKVLSGKPALYVINKCDLAEEADVELWCRRFEKEGKAYVKAVGTTGDCRHIVEGLKRVARDKLAKFEEKGARVNVRAMVVGVPNSGKSTVINAMVRKAKAVTGDKPGVTRGKQWLSVDGVDFLDTPGTLWGKFDNQTTAHHLAYIGSIRDEVLDIPELVCDLLDELKEIAADGIESRYGVDCRGMTAIEIFDAIAAARGYKLRGGDTDYERSAKAILDDFRKGRLGKIMLEKPMRESGLVLKILK